MGHCRAASASRSSSFRPKRPTWSNRCGSRLLVLRRLSRISSRSPTAPAVATRERTHTTVKRILGETMLTPAAHLTCVGASRAEIDAVVAAYSESRRPPHCRAARRYAGRRGRALRPRIPTATASMQERPRRRHQTHRRHQKDASFPGLPGKAPQTAHLVAADINMLKAKVDAGATARDDAVLLREQISISATSTRVPGQRHRISRSCRASCRFRISRRVENFAARCGTSVPGWLAERFDGLDDDAAMPAS